MEIRCWAAPPCATDRADVAVDLSMGSEEHLVKALSECVGAVLSQSISIVYPVPNALMEEAKEIDDSRMELVLGCLPPSPPSTATLNLLAASVRCPAMHQPPAHQPQ